MKLTTFRDWRPQRGAEPRGEAGERRQAAARRWADVMREVRKRRRARAWREAGEQHRVGERTAVRPGEAAGQHSPDTMVFWRRRFVALATVLAVLAVLAWAFSGALGGSGVGHAAVGHGTGDRQARTTASGSADGAPALANPGTGGSGPTPSPAAPTSGPQGQSSPGTSGSAAGPGHALAGPALGAGVKRAPGTLRACAASDVVLSLFASRARYRAGQVPQFDVDVVSTAARDCAFNVGARYLVLAVRSHGRRVWVSSGCTAGRRSLPAELVRGVPTIVPFTWDLEKAGRRCAAGASRGVAGHFVAAAADGSTASDPVRFTAG